VIPTEFGVFVANIYVFQELELTGRSSLGRSEVISGMGGDLSTGEPRTDAVEALQDTRDKVATLLSELENGDRVLPVQEYVLLLGELLLHSDQVGFAGQISVSGEHSSIYSFVARYVVYQCCGSGSRSEMDIFFFKIPREYYCTYFV
jgi:hypothetical protein